MTLLTYGGSPVGPTTAEATTFVVTRTDDPAPDGCDSGGDCSLREAIIAAKADPSEPDVIQLQSGATYVLSIPNSGGPDEEEGDLDIAADT